MAEQKQDDQLEHTFSNHVRIRDVVQKTCQRRMNDREKWRERVRNIHATSTAWWWWWWLNIYAGWNDKIVTLEKTTWFHFRLMKIGFHFFFFFAGHLLVGQWCTNPKSNNCLLSCLKVTQCSTRKIGEYAAVQLMLSTDPNYYNRTIASTLKMPIRTVERLRAQLNASDDPLDMVERKPKAEDAARKTQTKEFIEKVQAIIDETPQRPIRQIASDLGVSHTTVNACVKEDLKWRVLQGPGQARSWPRKQRTSG